MQNTFNNANKSTHDKYYNTYKFKMQTKYI